MNFSVALMSGRIKGVQVDADRLINATWSNATVAPTPDPQQALPLLETSLLAADVSKQTHDAILEEIDQTSAIKPATARKNDKVAPTVSSTGTIAGLLLGSPEFQRR
jgi:hypothetical protein